jgi:hypothetical protein
MVSALGVRSAPGAGADRHRRQVEPLVRSAPAQSTSRGGTRSASSRPSPRAKGCLRSGTGRQGSPRGGGTRFPNMDGVGISLPAPKGGEVGPILSAVRLQRRQGKTNCGSTGRHQVVPHHRRTRRARPVRRHYVGVVLLSTLSELPRSLFRAKAIALARGGLRTVDRTLATSAGAATQ